MRVAIQTRPPTAQLEDDLKALTAGGHEVVPFTRVPFTGELEGFDPTCDFLRCTTESLRAVLAVAPDMPLYDHERFSQKALRDNLPALNAKAIDRTWREWIDKGWPDSKEDVFIRPCHDLKSFAGLTVDIEAYDPEALYARLEGQGNPMTLDDLVSVAPVQEIVAEYRFWIVGGRVAFYSTYRRDDRPFRKAAVPIEAYVAAVDFARTWLPVDTCVMDLALLKDGSHVVVEFNCANCSGFYAAGVNDLTDVYGKIAKTVRVAEPA